MADIFRADFANKSAVPANQHRNFVGNFVKLFFGYRVAISGNKNFAGPSVDDIFSQNFADQARSPTKLLSDFKSPDAGQIVTATVKKLAMQKSGGVFGTGRFTWAQTIINADKCLFAIVLTAGALTI